MNARINVPGLFTKGYPQLKRGNVTTVQKIITGLRGYTNNNKMYLRQNVGNFSNKLYRNTDVMTLPDGAYLYLIEYDPQMNRYYKQFVAFETQLELGSRHFQLPTRHPGRFIIAAGELMKKGHKITYNFESGTYMKNFMRNVGPNSNSKFKLIIENAFRNAKNVEYTPFILAPEVPTKIKNLLRFLNSGKGSVSYGFGERNTAETRAKALKYLRNLHTARVHQGYSSPNTSPSPSPKRRRASPRTLRRSPRLMEKK
jgi:hypothetical protein